MSLSRLEARIRDRRNEAPGVVELELELPALATAIQPGQFVMLLSEAAGAPYLGRPMSYFRRSARTLSVLFRVVGGGTRHLATLACGEHLVVLGPLGRPFPEPQAGEVCLVGGGVGVPPLYDWARELSQRGHPVTVLLGARSADQLLAANDFAEIDTRTVIATDDGSLGHRGPVTDLLPASAGTVYACGPTPMLKAVQAWARDREVATYLTLEARMACGFGACLGCSVEAKAPSAAAGDYGRYLRVCTEGPTFAVDEVVL